MELERAFHDIAALLSYEEEEEDQMMTSLHDTPALTGTEALVIETLQREGPLSFECLLERSGLDWPQMFLAIDDLTRSGKVWLERGQGTHYRVALVGGSR